MRYVEKRGVKIRSIFHSKKRHDWLSGQALAIAATCHLLTQTLGASHLISPWCQGAAPHSTAQHTEGICFSGHSSQIINAFATAPRRRQRHCTIAGCGSQPPCQGRSRNLSNTKLASHPLLEFHASAQLSSSIEPKQQLNQVLPAPPSQQLPSSVHSNSHQLLRNQLLHHSSPFSAGDREQPAAKLTGLLTSLKKNKSDCNMG